MWGYVGTQGYVLTCGGMLGHVGDICEHLGTFGGMWGHVICGLSGGRGDLRIEYTEYTECVTRIVIDRYIGRPILPIFAFITCIGCKKTNKKKFFSPA